MKIAVLALVALMGSSTAAVARNAGPDCQAIMLGVVTDDMGHVWKKGKILPVDIARETSSGGAFCTHGGSCLPRKIDGREAVRLTNCKIGPSIGDGDYRLVAKRKARKR